MKSSISKQSVRAALAAGFAGIASLALSQPAKLPAGMEVPLELQHHVTPKYVPSGSVIYFRVATDVVVDGQALISKGTLVTGKMEQAQNRGMVGRIVVPFVGIKIIDLILVALHLA